MTQNRKFHLGDVLTVSTGALVSPRHMEGVYDILNYMTGDNLFTRQLPRALGECRPWILRQHPQLAECDASDVDKLNWEDWLSRQVDLFGEELTVEPIPQDDHERIDPITEAESMVNKDKIIVVQLGDDDDQQS